MRYMTLAIFVAAIALLGVANACADAGVAPWHATIPYGGAYDITYDEQTDTTQYHYYWEVTFNGIGTGDPSERMTAFALYYLPDVPTLPVGCPTTVSNPNTGTRTVNWSSPSDPKPTPHGITVGWSADNPTLQGTTDAVFVGETIGLFMTTFDAQLPDSYLDPTTEIPSGVHVQWGEDSEWVNQTPEPVTAVLLALGIPTALVARRRKTG